MITRFKGLFDPECELDPIDWQELFSEFSQKQPFRGNSHPGWSAAEFDPPKRALKHVKHITALVLDYDNQTKSGDMVEKPHTIEELCAHLGDYYGFIHTTRHHTKEWPRFRVILPLRKPVNRLEYASLWQAAARLWPGVDPAPKDPSRFWYTPGVADQPDAEFQALTLTGAWLDPDSLVTEQPALLRKPAGTVESDGLTEARARAYIDKMPPAVSGAHGHKALWNVTRKLVCDFGLDEQAAYRILQSEYNPRCQPPWSEKDIRHKLREAITKSRIANPIQDRPMEPAAGKVAIVVAHENVAETIAKNGNWEKHLRSNKDGAMTKDVGNVALILKNLPGFAGCLKYDRMSYRCFWQREPSFDVGLRAPEAGETIQDHHIVYVQQVLAKQHGLTLGKDIAWAAIESAAHESDMHPVQDYLNSLQWDGQPRLAKWLHTYVGCDDTDYNASVGRWWLISAVARAMHPGCQVDYCLILEGPQGFGKSQAIIAIADPWYLGTLPDIRDRKDAADTIGGSWIIEIAELDALKGASMTAVKAFVTQQVDKYRPAYARATVERPRSCVFIGTTNEKLYLSDPTGARRFWPVEIKRPCDVKSLVSDRDQLWAEVVAAWRSGEQWYPDRGYLATIEEEQSARYMEDDWTEVVREWIKRSRAEETGFTSAEVLGTALNIPQDRWDRVSQMRVGAILTKLGYAKRRAQVEGDRVYRYFKVA